MNNISKSKQGYKKTKWLFGKEIEIPKEWNIKKFRDISKINPEKIDKEYWNQNILYVDIGSIDRFQIVDYDVFVLTDRPSRAQRIIKKNDVIVSTVRPYLKAFSKIKKDKSNMVCSTGFTVIRTKNKDDGELIFQFIQSKLFEMHMVREMEGLAYPAVTSKVVANSLIPYPIDKHEKQKIASILSGVDALIESAQKTIEKTERLKKGLMQQLLARGINHKKFKSVKWLFGKEIQIPEEWEMSTIEGISKKLVSGGTPSTTILEYWNGDIPWTRSSILLDPYLKSGEKFITSEGLKNSSSVLIPKNNLLVSSRVSVGNISINAIDIAISQDVTGIIINKSYAQLEFLYWYLKQYIKKLVLISQGTTIKGFTRKELANLLIFLPSLSEQQKIASILSGVDAVRHHNIITSIILRIKFAIFLILCV